MLRKFLIKFIIIVGFVMSMNACSSSKELKNRKLNSVEIEMTGRGSRQSVKLNENYIIVNYTDNDNSSTDQETFEEKGIQKPVWKEVNKLVSEIDLNNFENFTAPTQDRFFDGARTTTIILRFADGELNSQAFDEGKPPAELSKLYNYLVSEVNQ